VKGYDVKDFFEDPLMEEVVCVLFAPF